MLDCSWSVSDTKHYIEYIIKKHEILATTSPIHIYINRINNRWVFKIKDGYKLELQMSGTFKSFGNTNKLKDKTKKEKNVPNLEVAKVVLFQCSFVDNQYQQKSEVLNTYTQNIS